MKRNKETILENADVCQNWNTVVGYYGKNGLVDYVELRIDPREGSPLYKNIEYTEEDWKRDHPQHMEMPDGDYRLVNQIGFTMCEAIDHIIAYVCFEPETHEFVKVDYACGSVDNRDIIVPDLGEAEKNLVRFAKQCLSSDLENGNYEKAY